MHIDILRSLRDAARMERPKKLRIKIWFHFHDNAPAHRSVSIKSFLAKKQCDNMEHSPVSPDQAAADFYMYHQLKSAMKGRRFCVATEIIKNATEELKMLSPDDFQECF